MNKSIKIKASERKNFSCGYLYADGHLVLCFSKKDKKTGVEIRYATIHKTETKVIDVQNYGLTRIFLSTLKTVEMATSAIRVDFWKNNSTLASEEKNIEIQTTSFIFSYDYGDRVDIHDIPGLISGDVSGSNLPFNSIEDCLKYKQFGDHAVINSL